MLTRKSGRPSRRIFVIATCLALLSLLAIHAGGAVSASSHAGANARPTIVLVHGDWADGSSWTSVIKRLQRKGLTVAAPRRLAGFSNPEHSPR